MSSLAVFDFDYTIVDNDSDATIINRLREKQPPPEWDAGNNDWTPYMSDVFEHAYSAGLEPIEILDCIASMKPTPGVEELITTMAARGWEVLILTDANSVFVEHWLKTHGLKEAVTAVVTNRAFWRRGRLYIEPCMRQSGCARCPANLCKARALQQWRACRPPGASLVYVGDGRNDYCAAASLPPEAIVFPRRGYRMDELIRNTLATARPEVRARVLPWNTCHDITKELFPDLSASKQVGARKGMPLSTPSVQAGSQPIKAQGSVGPGPASKWGLVDTSSTHHDGA